MSTLVERYEFKRIWALLDCLQLRADNTVYSKESPAEDHVVSPDRVTQQDRLVELLHPYPPTNEVINVLFNQLMTNYVGACREMLKVEV